MKVGSVVVEALVVGVVMMALCICIHFVLMNIPATAGLSMDVHKGGPLQVFLTGVIGHILFEVTNVNKWYCTNGAACTPGSERP